MQLSESNFWQRFWQLYQTKGIRSIFTTAWSYLWLRFAGLGYFGRIATWLATWFAPPYKMRRSFARYYPTGYISPGAIINHADLQLGANIYIGDRVRIFQDHHSGSVGLAEGVNLHNDSCLQTGDGGSIKIGADTHIQPRCQFYAYQGLIQIGSGVQIASNCVFNLGENHFKNQSSTKKGIIVEDDVWLGHGAMVLDGVRIGKGAVIGSGAVVERDVEAGAIAVGVPARVIGSR
ncbi:MAG: acyltransferase [Waterburya sp.]